MKGRDCIEQILCLRLLIDYVKTNKKKLFIVFIDFQKAYDRVHRDKLFSILVNHGCGNVFILALKAMYKVTVSIFKTTQICASIGVKQGSPTRCILFVIYINSIVRALKSRLNDDGFLGSLHCLLYMDDMVIVATNREELEKKVNHLISSNINNTRL